MAKFLIICGPSGSGKTTVRDDLMVLSRLDRYPLSYFKLIQMTSREKRQNEHYQYYDERSSYLFINEDIIRSIKNQLIGVNDNVDNFGGIYGTLPIFTNDKINIIILSYEGLTDFINKINNPSHEIFIAYLELENSYRESRDISFEKNRLLNYINNDTLFPKSTNIKIKKFIGSKEVRAEKLNEWLESFVQVNK